MPTRPGVEVSSNLEASRYELLVDGQVAGLAVYVESGGVATITHTEVDRALQGRGLAGQLVGCALDDLRRRSLQVVPACSYVRDFMVRHAEYRDLLPADHQGPPEPPPR